MLHEIEIKKAYLFQSVFNGIIFVLLQMENKRSIKDRLGWLKKSVNTKGRHQTSMKYHNQRRDQVSGQQKKQDGTGVKAQRPNNVSSRRSIHSRLGNPRKVDNQRKGGQGNERPNKNINFRNNSQQSRENNQAGRKTEPKGTLKPNHQQNRDPRYLSSPGTPCSCQSSNDLIDEKDPHISIPIIVCFKKVPGRLDCLSGQTRIGSDLGNLAIANGASYRDQMITINGKKRQLKVLVLPMGVRLGRMKRITCVVDPDLPRRSVMVGLPAIKSLGFQFTIDSVPARYNDGSGATTLAAFEGTPVVDEQWAMQADDEGDWIEPLGEKEVAEVEGL